MNELDVVAERNPEFEGFRLIDYGPVALPYYVLYVTAVLVERRPLPPVSEYVFRSIRYGLRNEEEIAGFLGLQREYLGRLLVKLEDERFIVRQPDASVRLSAKADEVLQAMEEVSPVEREVRFLWDLVQKKPSGYVESLKRAADVGRDHEIPIRAFPMRAPNISEIPVQLIQSSISALGRGKVQSGEIIRLRQVNRRLLRYRPAVALVYAAAKGGDFRIKFAIDGKIDNAISLAFAEQGGPDRMGLSKELGSKVALTAVRQRVDEISGGERGSTNYAALVNRRAVLRWSIRGIEQQLLEGKTADLQQALAAKAEELERVDAQLRALPIRELMPFELPIVLRDALRRARSRIIVSTTRPTARRTDHELLGMIREAAAGGVRVVVLVSEKKVPLVDGDESGRRDPLIELGRLAGSTPNIQVRFLGDAKRNLFEIVCDDEFVAVASDSPLGRRPQDKVFIPFAGMLLSSKKYVTSYVNNHLKDWDDPAQENQFAIRTKTRSRGRKQFPKKSSGARARR